MENKSQEQQRRYVEWQQLINDQEQSGLTQKEFCQQKNLILSKFVYYRSLIKKQANLSVKKTTLFSPVKLSNQMGASSGEIKISTPNGFQVSFSAHSNTSDVKRFLEAILSC